MHVSKRQAGEADKQTETDRQTDRQTDRGETIAHAHAYTKRRQRVQGSPDSASMTTAWESWPETSRWLSDDENCRQKHQMHHRGSGTG